jgi:hypothetical protein
VDLQRILADKDRVLHSKYEALKLKAIEELLPRIYVANPGFTGHDAKHSKTIVENLNKLLTDEVKNRLVPYEIFFLLAAAYYHDIGMIASSDECDTEEKRRNIRAAHHIRSKEFIKNNYIELGLTNSEALILADVCYGHRKVDIENEIHDRTLGQGNNIRVRLLASCILLADELDATAERAPEILMKILKLNNLSRQHFTKHIDTIGIKFDEPNGLIILDGIIKSEIDKSLLFEMHLEIEKKLETVSRIFLDNGLPWEKVILDADERDFLRLRVYLCLTYHDEFEIDVLAAEYGTDRDLVKTILRDARFEGIIQEAAKGKFILKKELPIFQKIADFFLGEDYELEFIQSPYSLKCIRHFFFNFVKATLDVSYDQGEKEDREIILANSPTALKNVLDGKYPNNTGLLTIKPILDLAIMQGYLIDLFKYPIIGCHDVRLAAETILWQIKKDIPSLSNLLASLSVDEEKDEQEVYSDIMKMQGSVPDKDPKFTVNVRLKHSSKVEPHLSFSHLLKASLTSGEKLEIDGHHIDEIRVTDANGKVTINDRPIKMAITPGKRPPHLKLKEGMTYFRLSIDSERKKLIIFLDTARSLDLSKYPFLMTMKFAASGTSMDVSFASNPFCSIAAYLLFDRATTMLTDGNIRRMVIYDDQKNVIMHESIVPTFNNRLALSRERIKFFRFIEEIQRVTGKSFCFLQFLPDEFSRKILTENQPETDWNREVAEKFITGYEKRNNPIVIYRVTTLFDSGKFYLDEFFGPFPGLITPPKIKIQSYKSIDEKKSYEQGIANRTIDWKIVQFSNYDMETIRSICADSLNNKHELPATSDLLNNTDDGIPRSVLEIEVSSLKETFSREYQVVQVRMRDATTAEQKRLVAGREFENKNYANALDKYCEMMSYEPDNAEIRGMIGWLYYLKEDFSLAEKYTVDAIERDNTNSLAFVRYNLGLFSLKNRDFKAAEDAYAAAMSVDKGAILQTAIDDIKNICVKDNHLVEDAAFKDLFARLQEEVVVQKRKPAKNRPCTCGSGKKYKKCCGKV